jgi:hypothetical protein
MTHVGTIGVLHHWKGCERARHRSLDSLATDTKPAGHKVLNDVATVLSAYMLTGLPNPDVPVSLYESLASLKPVYELACRAYLQTAGPCCTVMQLHGSSQTTFFCRVCVRRGNLHHS